ncbi:hypothetical protein [Paenibacillus sp. 32352]|uniref:hypothetical protein n=1 Tax=Paenibacillus sp. 32352 TaxID=1969111 RepID=UPI0009AC686D|nr:hypothetical protein [Paenibacillus sp. 32352]
MNLLALLEKQREEDRGMEGDFLPNKILQLQIELGKLAENWRGHMYWDKDQFPRHVEIIVSDGECGTEIYNRYPLLESYLSCLRWILSIGNEVEIGIYYSEKYRFDSEIDAFQYIYHETSLFANGDDWKEIFNAFLALGVMLDIDWNEVEKNMLED